MVYKIIARAYNKKDKVKMANIRIGKQIMFIKSNNIK